MVHYISSHTKDNLRSNHVRTLLLTLAIMIANITNVWGQTDISSLSDITDPTGHYRLTSDVSGSGHTSIATFSGILEAAIDPDTKMPYRITDLSTPLFTTLTGTVKNLVLEDVSISGNTDNTGAIAGTANGAARIYNVGILSGSVGGSGNTGGLVGLLGGTARVVNCYSYADIISGTNKGGIVGYNNVASSQSNVATMVMNCMFYGTISTGGTISPIFGGQNIDNKNSGGLATYNYYLYRTDLAITNNKYNCALAVEEKFFTRFEFYRQLENSNKRLASIYATGSADNADSKMLKWVLETADKTISDPKPYPILKAQGNYPSIINYDADNAPDSASVGRNHGGKLGKTLSVSINSVGSNAPTGASITTNSLSLQRTDKDFDRFNYNYDKVQLPYYNDVGSHNYTGNRVVTGWKITSISGGTAGTYSAADEWGGYNFADRNCTDKDLYSVSGRVFSQGAYFDVPYGVTAITIEPYWGVAAYVSDQYYDVVYKEQNNNNYGGQNVTVLGTQAENNTDITINGSTQKVYTSIDNARSSMNIPTSGKTVYDYAVVLVGNVHQAGTLSNATTPYTITSVDLDKDNEPDYSFIFSHYNRQPVSPIRFDFLNVVGTAQAQKPNGTSVMLNVSIFKPKGWFEVTNTCNMYFVQFEGYNGESKTSAPIIFLGGVVDQFTSTQNQKVTTQTQYIHLGSNCWFKAFGNGTHSDGFSFTSHVPVSVTGGDFESFYLSGVYRPDAGIQQDNAECYISGGRFNEVAGAAQQMIDGDVHWQIYNADIANFYGGGINAAKPITGDITVDISNSYVDTYCGGPKFGDMQKSGTTFTTKYSTNQAGSSTGNYSRAITKDGKVTTNATGCEFNKFFGAGYGGTSYSELKFHDATSYNFSNLTSNYTNDRGKYFTGQNTAYKSSYGKKGPGVATDFSYEFFVWSSGKVGARFYVKYASFSLAQCNDVESKLKNCTINTNFYGGGSIGKVDGTATSELENCTVSGSVYAGGYSASLPTIPIRSAGFTTMPNFNNQSGMFEPGVLSATTDFDWTAGTLTENTTAINTSEGNKIYTDADLTTLGQVAYTDLTIKGTTTVAGSVYGGGEESAVGGAIEVNIQNGTISTDVFGGGKKGEVSGNITVNVTGGQMNHDIYGGGALAKANTTVTDGTYPTTTVNLLGGTIVGDAYGGGLGNDTTEADAGNTKVNLNGIDQAFYNAADASLKTILDELVDKTSGSTDYYPLNPTLKGCIVNRIFGANNVNGSPKGDVTVHVFATQNKDATKATNIAQKFVSDKVVNDALEDTDTPTLASLKAILADKIKVAKLTVLGINTDSYEATYANASDTAAVRTAIKSITTAIDNAADTDEKKAAVNALRYDVKAVYGGGNEAAYRPATPNTSTTATPNGSRSQVIIDGCDFTSIETVYGGGNAAAVPETNVDVNGAYEIEYVFGGGNGKDNKSNGDPNPGADVGIYDGNLYGTGNANTTIWGGTIHEVYGASNQKGNIKGSINLDVKQDGNSCPLTVEKVVGAGKNADIDGDIILVMGCMPATKTPLLFGGADNANVNGNVELTITSGTFGKVFGGNNLGGIIKGHIFVNIEETGCRPINIDELYLGGNQAAYSRYGYYDSGNTDTYDRPVYLPRESAEDTHTAIVNPSNADGKHPFPYDDPVLNVISCTSIGKVFGGGLGTGAAMYADPTVNINMVQGAYYTTIGTADGNNPHQLGAVENVYGGGNEAAVYGSTTVNVGTEIGNDITLTSTGETKKVLGAYITGTVYGAGKGTETTPEAAVVTGNTLVRMAGGHVSRSIYGGGELGSVGTFTDFYTDNIWDADKKAMRFKDEPKTCKEGTGLAEVIITGGQVGLNKQHMPNPSESTSDDDYGYVFCASKGIADSTAYTKANLLAVVNETHLQISGGLIIASVYGGSENGEVLGDTHVEISGGQIGTGYYKDGGTDHWDGTYTEEAWNAAIEKVRNGNFADADAAGFHECDAWPFKPEGSRFVYDYFADDYDSKGGSRSAGNGHSFFGNVFGGGSGYYPFAPGEWRRTAGRVCGDTYVTITGGHILTNVYGGNEITDVLGKCKVEMSGGTVGVPRTIAGIQARPVNSYIFGAGMGDPRTMFNNWSNVAESEVIVKDSAVVFGSVFGGGEDGHVLGNASTTIEGNAVIGTFGSSGVDGNIFGSGRGFSAIALTSGVVCGNVTVDIKDNAKILGSVFGGGRLAAVGTYLAADGTDNYGKMQPGNDHGNITINITGGTIGNQSKMNDHQYSVGDVFGGSKGALMDEWAKSQMLGLVKNTTINISQADAAKPTTIYGNVYGGGEIASVGSYTYATAAQATTYNSSHASEPMAEGDVYGIAEDNTGLATISITGGTIGQNSIADTHGLVFGGCLGKAGPAYSGYSFVNNSVVTLNGGTVYGCVFGGGENGHLLNNTQVNIKSGTVGLPLDKENIADADLNDNMIYRGNVYGGGRGIDQTSGGDYSITAGKVAGNTNVTIEGGIVYRNVYGGGSLASVGIRDEESDTNGKATVTIKGGQIGTDGGASANDYTTNIPNREHRRENGFVFGSGRGMAAGAVGNSTLVHLAYTKNTVVNIEGTANVTGSVFGGGENGHVSYNTKVYVKDSSYVGTELTEAEHVIDDNGRGRLIYRGNVYGGGRGIDMGTDGRLSLTAGLVSGNTFVEVSGGKIYHDVFGGGSLATVGTATVDSSTGTVTYGTGSGKTEVHIKGGIIGYSTDEDQQGFNCGFVYGGCRGLAAAPNTDVVKMAYVHNAYVYIEPGADIKGSVFGGGANGHVNGNTNVEISGGSIGTKLLADEVGFDDHGVAVKPVFRGNVYAGGRGVDLYQQEGTDSYSLTAGAVYGNATLLMTGGHVWHNVYGSGAMASVGTVQEKPAGAHVHDEIVNSAGTVVNPDGSNVNYLTGVFKENTGTVTVTITGGTVGDTTPGHEGRNNGRVYGAGRGVSASRADLVASMEYVNDTHVTIGTDGQTSYTAGNDAPYIYGAVFGGGENGHVKTDTHVNIYSGIIGWPLDEGATQQYKTSADGASKNPFRGHVFGGGRGVDPLYHSSTETRSSTAGRVYGHTNVTMTGGVVRRAIYGGGLLASVGVYQLAESDLHIIDKIEDEVDGGKATITISGGYIGNVNADGTAVSGTGLLTPGDNNGHVFGSSCGMVADNYTEGGVAIDQQYRQMGYSHSTEVNISGGHLFGSVFGSGENGHVWEDSRLNISGGEIGSETSTLIYSGNVYGSGRGVDHPHEHISETAGKVRGNTTVNITGGTVWRDVYGGGSLASVGEEGETGNDSDIHITDDPLTTNPYPFSSGLTRVYIHGTSDTPEIHGSVYGSGRGVASSNTEYRQAAYVKNTLVTVGKAHVYNNVFGGGNAGHVRRNTVVDILDQAKVDGNVYGGGAGSLKSPTAGLVNHDVTVNIKGGLIGKDVYGGGAIANTNTHDKRNNPSLYADGTTAKAHASTYGNPSEDVFCKTEVNLTGGIILGNAYGGGQGVIPDATATEAEIANAGALVRGDVTVTLNGTAFHPTTTTDDQSNTIAANGRIFGCNNLNGTPQGTVLVHVLQTKGVTQSGETYSINNTKPALDSGTYEVQAVYGGGNLAAYEPWDANANGQYATNHSATERPVQVVIDGCDLTSIEYVYGGGNAAATPSTDVMILGAYEIGNVFGGGNGKDRINKSGTWEENPGADVGLVNSTDYGTGKADTYLMGGYIHSAFGGSNTKGSIRESAEVHMDEAKDGSGNAICPLQIDEVYGGGNEAYLEGGVSLDLGCITRMKAIYGGAKAAGIGKDVVLTITSGHYDRVFGGNNISGEIKGSITVNIEETGCNPVTIGELYGCGNQAAYTTPAGKPHPTINIKSFTSIGRVFGGGLGEGAVVTGNPTININEVLGGNAGENSVYAGQTITLSDGTTVALPAHTLNKIGAIGTVFGGGNAAKVVGNTTVNVGTKVGEPIIFITPESDDEVARTKTVIGANITGNVFGGGNEAEVTGNSNVIVGKKH